MSGIAFLRHVHTFLLAVILLPAAAGAEEIAGRADLPWLDPLAPESVQGVVWKHAKPRPVGARSAMGGKADISRVHREQVQRTLSAQSDVLGTYVQSGHSGPWYNPDQDGHGLFVDVLADDTSPTGLRVVLSWYAFFNGEQAWIIADGQVLEENGRHIARMSGFIYSGPDFPPFYNPAQLGAVPWGELTLRFDGCIEALLTWNSVVPGFGAGEMLLRQIISVLGTSCDPGLGGTGRPSDDHGDTAETATGLSNTELQGVNGRMDFPGDIDVFTFTLPSETRARLFATGSINTYGELYRFSSGQETQLQTDNDSGVGMNFLIERDLNSGTYTVHVRALDGSQGDYTVWLETVAGRNINLRFENNLYRPADIYVNGAGLGGIPQDTMGQVTLFVLLGDVVSFEVDQNVGDEMGGIFDPIDEEDLLNNALNFSITNVIGTESYFVPFVTNLTGNSKRLGVNMELDAENRTDVVIPSDGVPLDAGYFKLFGNSNCRLYDQGDSNYEGGFIEWSGTDITSVLQENSGRVDWLVE